MPKIPKKVPNWITPFIDFAKQQETKKDVQRALDTFQQVINNRWADFAASVEDEQKESPPKTRKVDPVKAFGKALERVADQAEIFGEDDVVMNEYKERLTKVVPEQVKPLFQELISSASGSPIITDEKEKQKVNGLIAQTSKDLTELAATTKRVSEHADSIHSAPLKQEAESAVQTIHRVANNFNQLKSVYDVKSSSVIDE